MGALGLNVFDLLTLTPPLTPQLTPALSPGLSPAPPPDTAASLERTESAWLLFLPTIGWMKTHSVLVSASQFGVLPGNIRESVFSLIRKSTSSSPPGCPS